jgi:hypothetical protein
MGTTRWVSSITTTAAAGPGHRRMVFDFGPIAHFIDVTAQYSNAVLVAVMPYVTDFARKLELPNHGELKSSAVRHCAINPKLEDVSGGITFTNGYGFSFGRGHITGFYSPHAYSKVRDHREIPKYFGTVKMTKEEAVSLARESMRRLGYRPETVFADLEPDVTPPEKVGDNTIPYYEVRWPDPRGGKAVTVEINGHKRTLERLTFFTENLSAPSFKVSAEPILRFDHPLTGLRLTGVNPEYGYKLLPIVMSAVTRYAANLGVELPSGFSTNHVKRFFVTDNGGWPHAELELTNGCRFVYRNAHVVGYFEPDEFWNSDKRKITLAEFRGAWRMTDGEMIALARKTIAKLGYPERFVRTKGTPELIKPKGRFAKIIPRCKVEWMYPDAGTMTQWAYVEIDGDKRRVKAVYFDDETFRTAKPPIDVPIAVEQ